MTNQEAIKILDNLKPGDYSNPYEKGESIVMAIEALQAQPESLVKKSRTLVKDLVKEPCEDAVSREAVTDVIRHSDIFSTWNEMDDTDDIVEDVIDEARKQLVDDVNELPSVTPKCPECDDAVSLRAAIEKSIVCVVGAQAFKAVPVYVLEHLPSVQPNIIHCKECEYGVQDEYERWYCRGFGCQVGEEDGSGFCADAERKK